MKDFRPQDAGIFRPYRDEVPWDLLTESGAEEDDLAAVLELNLVRVAKFADRAIGAYGIRPITPVRFELVALVVDRAWRRRGLGRWLLGHAIGLAETKGAREILVRHGSASRGFLERFDFVPGDDGLLLTLTPE